jgi:hypothetical protein
MRCRSNPADLLTRQGHATTADSLKPSAYSLFPIPYSLPHGDSNHGEHKFPPFRGVPPSFQSTSSFFICMRKCPLGRFWCIPLRSGVPFQRLRFVNIAAGKGSDTKIHH